MQGNQAFLNIGPCSHFCCAANDDPHLTGVDLREQGLFLLVGVGIMDKGDLLRRHTSGNQFLLDIIIDGKGLFGILCKSLLLF